MEEKVPGKCNVNMITGERRKLKKLSENHNLKMIFGESGILTFIVRHLNPVFVLTVRSFLRDGPLNAQYTCRGLER
jgi:hypothetical protein